MKEILTADECSGLTHIGPMREDNQDAIRLPNGHHSRERGGLCALADGMGGYAQGRLASTLALETLFDAYYGERSVPVPLALRRGIQNANLAVYKKAQQLGVGRMGTTLTAASVSGNKLHLAHVGDSRAYLIRNHRAICLTNDHTTVGELVRMKVLTSDHVRQHAQRSVLTKGLGLSLFVKPDIAHHALRENDYVVLCSDGAWSVIQDDEFAQLAKETSNARKLSQNVIDLALERKTDDNVSVIVMRISRLSSSTANESKRRRFWWLPAEKGRSRHLSFSIPINR